MSMHRGLVENRRLQRVSGVRDDGLSMFVAWSLPRMDDIVDGVSEASSLV